MKIENILFFLLLSFSSFSAFSQEDEFDEFEAEGSRTEMNSSTGISLSGFIDFEQGVNITDKGANQENGNARDYVLANRRLRLKTIKTFDKGSAYLKLDFNHDEVTSLSGVDIREAKFTYKLGENTDLSVGRQITTWGVGDLIFINDLFPKNWIAHFTGREMDMLKDPADSIRVTSYMSLWIYDLVVTPKFSPDTTPNGCRFEILDINQNEMVSNPMACSNNFINQRNGNGVDEGEIALSVKRKIGNHEVALYGYKGFYKSPKGLEFGSLPDNTTGLIPYYPKLEVIGMSDEGQVGPGIFSFEYGIYSSQEDLKGDDYFIENSSMKYLLAYKMDITKNYSLGLQWYQDKMSNYKEYEKSYLLFNPGNYQYRLDEHRNTYTLRVGFKGMQDTLFVNWFSYFRPEDRDTLHKLEIIKRMDDQLQISTGVNLFDGDKDYQDRDFGMLRNGDNIYTRLKFVF